MDMSFMSKFLVQGRDAGKCLNRLSTANVDGAVGMITYTQWLNPDGKMEADITITKMADDKYLVVVTDTMHRHVETWARRNLDPEGKNHVFITDVTGGYSQLNIQGPRSRELLQKLTDTDMSNEAYPFRSAREIAIGYVMINFESAAQNVRSSAVYVVVRYIQSFQMIHYFERFTQIRHSRYFTKYIA